MKPTFAQEKNCNPSFGRKHKATGTLIIVLLLAGSTLLLGLGTPQLWDRDEPRNAGCTAEMLSRGDWVVPVFNNELRTHKPILLYWLQMASYQLIGVGQWGARLPSAILMIGTILCTMLLSARLLSHRFLFGRAEGDDSPAVWLAWNSSSMWSGIVLTTSLMMIVAGRAATPDSPLIFCSTLAITLLVFALTSSPASRYRELLFIAGYVALGLGVLAKGPVGFVLPFTVISAWYLWERHALQQAESRKTMPESTSRASFWYSIIVETTQTLAVQAHPRMISDYLLSTRLWIGIPILMAVALPWYIWVGVRTDGVWLREFFWDHNVQRAVQSLEGHRGGPLYYPMASLVGLFPWSLWLAPFGVWLWLANPLQTRLFTSRRSSLSDSTQAEPQSNRKAALARLSFLWTAIFIGAFSCANTKLPSYITPCYPGAALLIGLFFAHLTKHVHSHMNQSLSDQIFSSVAFRRALGATLVCSVLGGVVAAAALGIAAQREAMPNVTWHGLWSLGISVAGLAGIGLLRRKQYQTIPLYFAAGAAICLTGWMAGGASAVSEYRHDLTALVLQQQQHPQRRWLAIGVLEPSWVFYTGHPIRELQTNELKEGPNQDWVEQSIDHLNKSPENGIITLAEHAEIVTERWQQTYPEKSHQYRLIRQEYPYFLRNQNLVLITQNTIPLIPHQTAQHPEKNLQ